MTTTSTLDIWTGLDIQWNDLPWSVRQLVRTQNKEDINDGIFLGTINRTEPPLYYFLLQSTKRTFWCSIAGVQIVLALFGMIMFLLALEAAFLPLCVSW